MRTFLYNNRRFFTLLLIVVAFLPLQAAYGQACDIPSVRFEIQIFNKTAAQGITNYFVDIIFPAMLVFAPIITLFKITLSAAKLSVSLGNASAWSQFLESVRNALLLLVLFISIPFTLVLLGNEEIPVVCPEGLNFAERGFWYECQTTVASNSSECANYDYCDGPLGCSCGTIEAESSSGTKRCLPVGANSVGEGERCQTSSNCIGELRCFNATETTPGICSSIEEGAYCNNDGNCPADWSCVETELWANNNGRKGCYPNQDRALNSYCTEDSQCETGLCFNAVNITNSDRELTEEETQQYAQYDNRCVEGNVDSPVGCVNDSFCGPGYHCDEETSECRYNQDGDACESSTQNMQTEIFDCIPTDETRNPDGVMYCIATSGTPIRFTCQDGSPGSRCYQGYQCLSRRCTGTTGALRGIGSCE